MGKFNDRLMTEFWPPRKWKLGRDLTYTTKDITADEIKTLKGVGVKVQRDTNKTESIVVPKGFETDLASVPRAAIIHDLLYKTIRQYRWKMKTKQDEELVAKAKVISDKVFLLAMNDAEPPVAQWKKYSAWKAVDLFGNGSIVPNKDNI